MGSGPLSGVKIIEIASVGPGPFCAMLLCDMGADVIRVDRRNAKHDPMHPDFDITGRGRRSIGVDLKTKEGVEAVLKLCETADIIQEGFRPGVMERLGLGPDVVMKRNPKIIYGRMTGWGQYGPYAHTAGHDINYISLTGVLHSVGRKGQPPTPPLNLAGDWGGGGVYLCMGILAALFEAQKSGKGQIIDAAMTDGSASLMASFCDMLASGTFPKERGTGDLDSGSATYDAFECKDGKYISFGIGEPQFYAQFLKVFGFEGELWEKQLDRSRWAERKPLIIAAVKKKTREEWREQLEGSDLCFSPVMSLEEAPYHPHNVARKTFIEANGVMQPNVAPRFSRTESKIQGPAPKFGEHTDEVLREAGYSNADIANLRAANAV